MWIRTTRNERRNRQEIRKHKKVLNGTEIPKNENRMMKINKKSKRRRVRPMSHEFFIFVTSGVHFLARVASRWNSQ